jgi:hypothetical protein
MESHGMMTNLLKRKTKRKRKRIIPGDSTISARHDKSARVLPTKTSSYYTQLSSTIAVALRKKWEEEVMSAENRRLEDPLAMDIISVQDVDLLTSGSALQSDR